MVSACAGESECHFCERPCSIEDGWDCYACKVVVCRDCQSSKMQSCCYNDCEVCPGCSPCYVEDKKTRKKKLKRCGTVYCGDCAYSHYKHCRCGDYQGDT
jgi:hypothetical protein